MAKQSDKLASAVKTEKAGGPLSGLFAEENEFDRRALWRIGSWGATAVGAVILGVMSNHWSLGLRREQVAAADLTRQAQQIQSLAKETQNETRRLASAIETLNNDRDRLFSRVTVIEQGLDSVTGALAKQNTPPAGHSAAPQAPPQASSMATGTPQTPQQSAAAAPAPALAPVTTTAAASPATEKPRADASKTDAAGAVAATNTPAEAAANAEPATTATTSPAPGSPAAAASLMAKSMVGPSDRAAPKLIEAVKPADGKMTDLKPTDLNPPDAKGADIKLAEAKVDAAIDTKGTDAAATASSEAVASAHAVQEPEADVTSIAVKRTDFAVDLGAAYSLGGLRALWRGVRHLNADLGALSPIIVIREGNTGLGMQLHLGAGPLKDAAAAAKICAVLAETKRPCETTVYDGQRLAMKADEPQSLPAIKAASEAKPAKSDAKADTKADAKSGSYRHVSYRHAKKEEPPPPPPKPESTSALSALFGRR